MDAPFGRTLHGVHALDCIVEMRRAFLHIVRHHGISRHGQFLGGLYLFCAVGDLRDLLFGLGD
ncbi:hypothetical protein D3C71_2100740 [compost metagenome]